MSSSALPLPVHRQYWLRSIGEEFFATFAGCNECGGVWQSAPPSPSLLVRYYQNNTQLRVFEVSAADARVTRDQVSFFTSGHVLTDLSVLEYGANTGVFLDFLRATTGAITHFEELNSESSELLRSKGHIEGGSGFKGIFMLHTLEHFVNPYSALVDAESRLIEGGFLAVEVPDHSIWDEETTTDNFEHISYFSSIALVTLLSRAGFMVDRIDTAVNTDYSQFNKRSLRVRARKKPATASAVASFHFNGVLEKRHAALKALAVSPKKLGVFGIGMLTDFVLSNSPLLPERVDAFFDGDESKQGTIYFGKVVTGPETVRLVDVVIVISSAEVAIRHVLQRSGFQGEVIGWEDLARV